MQENGCLPYALQVYLWKACCLMPDAEKRRNRRVHFFFVVVEHEAHAPFFLTRSLYREQRFLRDALVSAIGFHLLTR